MKRVVIIGGGFTGARVAKSLEKKFSVKLIDTKDYFEFTPGILKALIFPRQASRIQINHKNYLKNSEFIKSKVIKLDKKFVYLENKKIPYDYLVISSGSSYTRPFKEGDIVKTTRADYLKIAHNKLEKSKKIAIIGGGIVAVEIAGEIATRYKDKKITIIHLNKKLMERGNQKSSKYAETFLRKCGVKILSNHVAKEISNNTIKIDPEKKIESDLIFQCTGMVPNCDFITGNFKKYLNKKNALMVNDFLQIGNHRNIFAGGDVTNIKEEKTAQAAEKHANIIVKNINCIEEEKPLKLYKIKKRPIIISLGKYNAIFEYKNFVIVGLIPALLKYIVEKKTITRYKN